MTVDVLLPSSCQPQSPRKYEHRKGDACIPAVKRRLRSVSTWYFDPNFQCVSTPTAPKTCLEITRTTKTLPACAPWPRLPFHGPCDSNPGFRCWSVQGSGFRRTPTLDRSLFLSFARAVGRGCSVSLSLSLASFLRA